VKRRALLAAAAGLLAACASPPPRPRRRLTGADLYAVDPTVLRAAVLTDERVALQGVAIDLRTVGDGERFVIRMQSRAAADPRLPVAPKGRAWHVYALAADGASTLVTVRRMLMARGTAPDALEVTISAQPALVPAELLGAVPLRIEMLVDNQAGWFTLAEGVVDLRP
jgi:hypothetical protein